MTRMDRVVVAHRGWHRDYPENSLEAFDAAWRAGLAWCECDVHLSADGVAVVLHDDALNRTTTGTGPVRERTWGELSSLRLRDGCGQITEYHLPRLEDVIERMPGGCGMMVEIKPHDHPTLVAEVCRILSKHRESVIISFDPHNLMHAKNCGWRDRAGLLIEDAEVDPQQWPLVLPNFQLFLADPHRYAACAEIGVWTVNQEAHLRQLASHAARWIITDQPQLARQILQ